MKPSVLISTLLAILARAAPAPVPATADEDYTVTVYQDSACTVSQFSNTFYTDETCYQVPTFVRGKYVIFRYTSSAPGALEFYSNEGCSTPVHEVSRGAGGCTEMSDVIASFESF
ncbi:hypothetical protein M409DRAFT_19669 [Zasmidium cellare ATCC 36951]|uniref:AA1-like domain-containing protein n=1 Tax=Zasmidium cellare ATCC 36951 TaxID=1080233 RepID=A0A6A6CSJ4_ZASCE|nr:uncharacterized protein M409DRAFT_19669 [Zasmidium cellare ATCC 36951]KAF2170061.1 hypothetical protein M409DRAFT_19669 [Zasmidium cellare ATCC 36951]